MLSARSIEGTEEICKSRLLIECRGKRRDKDDFEVLNPVNERVVMLF